MIYYFDNYGWYTSEHLEGRSTEVVPTNLSETTTPGELRSNFTGYVWVELPYYEPVEPQYQVPNTQFEMDINRYNKRAAVKDSLIAYMAADNMSRVRSGEWTVDDLTGLLDDPAVIQANALMGTLSYELAAAQIAAATTPLLTPEIKSDWVSRLEAHYYLEG